MIGVLDCGFVVYIKGGHEQRDTCMKREKQKLNMNESKLKLKHVSIHQNVTNAEDIQRRSANYKPNIWKFDFLQSLASEYDEEEFGMKLKKGVIEVKKDIFVQNEGILKKLELVDWIQKLGLANHFEKEIKHFLETIHVSLKNKKNPNSILLENLQACAICFRLFRQNGFKVTPDIVGKFLDDKQQDTLCCDAKSIVELLEASHLGFEGENILDEAKEIATNYFLDHEFTTTSPNCINIKVLVERVVHGLELASHWRVAWFDVKWHVRQYQKEKQHLDPLLLQLAKFNFNIIQAHLQKELKDLSRWWENLGIKKELWFARNRLVESFMCATGVANEPKYKSLRKWLTKVIIFVLMIDDIYDIHASFEELNPFTMAFQRWDEKELEEAPEYMRICFNALKDVTSETSYEIGGEMNFHKVLPYLKKAWIDFSKALHMEAKWYKEGYIPSLDEYLSNGWISSSGPVILLHSHFATIHEVTHDIDNFLHQYEDLVYNVSLIIRLCNDLGTTVAERERGDAASSIICYMNEKNVREEEARKHIQEMINNAWKKINGICLTQVGPVEPFLIQAQNAARVAHTLYQNGDGFGIQDQNIKKHILSLVVEPL